MNNREYGLYKYPLPNRFGYCVYIKSNLFINFPFMDKEDDDYVQDHPQKYFTHCVKVPT